MMESLTDQILESDVIPILIEKELVVKCCVRGHHVYESNWAAKTGSKLKPCQRKKTKCPSRRQIWDGFEIQ